MSRGWAGGSTTAWRKARAYVLARDGGVCQIRTPGICITAATHADHIVAKVNGGTDDVRNLQAACSPCNLNKGAPKPTAPKPRTAPGREVVLIVGPPGAGKSTLAASLGLPHLEREQYDSDHAYIRAVITHCAKPDAKAAVIRTCETLAEQEQWVDMAGVTRVETMSTPMDECIRRCHRRGRSSWRGEVAAVKRWFASRAGVGQGDPAVRPQTQW